MNILITAIGSMSAECTISTLVNYGHNVYGCDIYPKEWHYISKLCLEVYQAPYATNEIEYIRFLIRIIKEKDIHILLPITDLEIDIINKHREQFRSLNSIISIQSTYSLSIARNKFMLYETFKNDPLIPSINTYRSSEINQNTSLNYPCIAKPIDGRSSEGLIIVKNAEELSLIIKKEKYIVQEMKGGNIITVDYVRDSKNGNEFSVAREELLRTKNGAGLTVKLFTDEKITKLVSHIGNKLNINGCINIEFIYNNKEYFLIDINPRFSAGIAFSCLAGYNMIQNHIKCLLGQPIDPGLEIESRIMSKIYCEKIIE